MLRCTLFLEVRSQQENGPSVDELSPLPLSFNFDMYQRVVLFQPVEWLFKKWFLLQGQWN